ncbi:MAG TPA: cupin domain-containing protein [Candidatus Limosilactobacillus intestinigallinarum]|jgi:quercetin dioxygenase-like cupin family protein|nr:cupin domain-containing protein [Candidatus Limosilactobacillus intestinigallinarum]
MTEQNKDNLFGIGEKNTAFGKYFTGLTYRHPLVKKDGNINVGVSNITFTPGARTNWHIHHDGYQILLVTSGQGWYQEAGQPAQKLQAGDHVVIPEGVKHWHGAAKDSWFSHVSITAGTSEWLAPVSEDEYQKLDSGIN